MPTLSSCASRQRSLFLLIGLLGLSLIGCDDQALGPDARGRIEGTVIDAETGDSLTRANVSTTPPTQSFLTDENGYFAIPRVETGNYTITADKRGFESGSVTVKVEKDQTASALIQLDPKSTNSSQADTSVTVDFSWRNESVNRDGTGPDSIFVNANYDITNEGTEMVSKYEFLFLIEHSEGPSRQKVEGDTLRPRGEFDSGEFRKHIPAEADSVYVAKSFFMTEE